MSASNDKTQTQNYKFEWFKTDETTVEPAKNALRDHERFKNFARKLLKGKGKDTTSVTTEKDLRTQLRELDIYKLQEHAGEGLLGAQMVNSSYNLERTTGLRKFGSRLQNFFTSFSDFLTAYSGIIELVRNAGQQYGEAAYQTLSILLTVVVNKSQNDLQISQLLSELHTAFPRLGTLLGVYPSSTLELHVASVYREVILFARTATTYFLKFSVRVWTAIGKPPSIGISVTNKTIMSLLGEVNTEALILLHKRNQEIHSTVRELVDQNQDLKSSVNSLETTLKKSDARIEELQSKNNELLRNLSVVKQESHLMKENSEIKLKQDDDDNLAQIASSLDFTGLGLETNIQTCRDAILNAFPNKETSRRKICARYEQMSPELLQSQHAYIRWLESTTSSFFLLYGQTIPEARLDGLSTTYSWLSPATSYVAQAHLKDGKSLLAYYCCHPDVRAKERHSFLVLSALIYQLLSQKSAVLRRKKQKYLNLSRHSLEQRNSDSLKGMMELLRDVLIEVATFEDIETTYIVIDRVDQCSSTLKVLDELALLVVEPNCKVKIMVTCDTSFSESWDLSGLELKLNASKLNILSQRVYTKGPWTPQMV